MAKMTWTLDASFEDAAADGPRLGVLTSPGAPQPDGSMQKKVFPTPAVLTYTRRGEPAHLTPDCVDLLPAEARAFQVSVTHFMDHLGPEHVANTPGGGRRYFGCRPTFVFLTPRDPVTFDMAAKPTNDPNATFVSAPTGCRKVTVEDYMRWVHAIQPDAFVALSEEAPSWERGAGKNKTQAAAKRTEAWLLACGEKAGGVPMFAAVQGGADEDARRASASAAASHENVVGFTIGSLGAGEAPGLTREALLTAAIGPLPKHKPRHVAGLSTPLEILECVSAGVDLLDASFCHVLTQQGYAMSFPTAPPADGTAGAASGKRKRRDGDVDVRAADEGAAGEEKDGELEKRLAGGGDAFKINVWALMHRMDKLPLMPGCDCFTCTNHSRAYVHHLLQCHEMTASVLLDIHNIHHYNRFFESIRDAIRAGTFSDFTRFHRDRAATLGS